MASRPLWPSDLINTFVDIITPDKFLAMAAKDSDIYVIDEENGQEIAVHSEPAVMHVSTAETQPIEIKPAPGFVSPTPLGTAEILTALAVEPTQRINPTVFEVDPDFPTTFRNTNLAVNWNKLEADMINVNMSSLDLYLITKQGMLDSETEKFAKNLIEAGKMMYNSGISMVQRGNELVRMINEFKISGGSTATVHRVHGTGASVTTSVAAVPTPSPAKVARPTTTMPSAGQTVTVQSSIVQPAASTSWSEPGKRPSMPFAPGSKKMASTSKLPRPKSRSIPSSAPADSSSQSAVPGPTAKVKASTAQLPTLPKPSWPRQGSTPKQKPVPTPRYQCDKCPQSFTTMSDLNLHIQLHQRYYTCDQCGVPFSAITQLDKHMRLHQVAGRFYCTWSGCYVSYADKYNLQKHLAKHQKQQAEGPKPYPCSYCDKSFASDNSLRKHVSTQHRDQHALVRAMKKAEQQ